MHAFFAQVRSGAGSRRYESFGESFGESFEEGFGEGLEKFKPLLTLIAFLGREGSSTNRSGRATKQTEQAVPANQSRLCAVFNSVATIK